jgi:hypothetical protein
MCYGVALPEPTGREFAGFESVDGGVRGILGIRHHSYQLLSPMLSAHDGRRRWCSLAAAVSP